MAVDPSDIILTHAEYHPMDMYRKEGGYHTSQSISNIVDSVFQPGAILDIDASESSTIQYRKVFLKNISGYPIYNTKVYGFNNKVHNFITFALERDIYGKVKLDGSEVIKDYRTAPRFTSETCFTEVNSDNAQWSGSDSCGILSDLRAQGIWLKMEIPRDSSDLATDEFIIGTSWTEVS